MRSKVEYGKFFWPIFCDLISNENPNHPISPDCSEYLFDCARQIFQYLINEDVGDLDLDHLFHIWVDRLCNYSFIEGVGQIQSQNMIQGYTYLVHQCIKVMKNAESINFK